MKITDPRWKNDKGVSGLGRVDEEVLPEGALDDQSNAFAAARPDAGAQAVQQRLSRENILKQAENLKNVEFPLLLPGIKVNTSPTDHAPIEQEQLAKFDGERWVLFGELLEAVKK